MTIDFNDYFWGEKNSGFDVLYHNMKFGLAATKDLSEFLREKSNLEEHNAKQITKLAGKVASGCVNGTFAPIWVVLRSSTERLATLHQQMVHKLSELVRDVSKYADEVHKKQKAVKEEEAGTLEAVQAMQSSSLAVQKSKDVYLTRLADVEKVRKDNGSAKELEKAETKLRKLSDEYKGLWEKHVPIKADFESKMSVTCKRFQEIEENHLKQMKEFLSTYIELLQSNHDMVGQVHLEFKRQYLEMPVDKLLEQFVLSKYTGLEKPDIAELNVTAWSKNNPAPAGTSASSEHNTPVGAHHPHHHQHPQDALGHLRQPVVGLAAASAATALDPVKSASSRALGLGASTSALPTGFGTPMMMPSSSTTTAHERSVSDAGGHPSTTTTTNAALLAALDRHASASAGGADAEAAAAAAADPASPSSMSKSVSASGVEQNRKHIAKSALGLELSAQPFGGATPQPQPQQQQQPSTATATTATTAQAQAAAAQPQKSSRRTTSLLNLFMSNTQGNREIRDSASSEVLSAPTSPGENNQSGTHIGRNPLRGSKLSAILRSGRSKPKTKKAKPKNDFLEIGNQLPEDTSVVEEKREYSKDFPEAVRASPANLSTQSTTGAQPTTNPHQLVDEDGYSIQPKEPQWETLTNKNTVFNSDSESDSEPEEPERKIHVEIKPLNNGLAPISASVDELRATVGALSLSPLGGVLSQHPRDHHHNQHHQQQHQHTGQPTQPHQQPPHHQQSPNASNTSTPTSSHPYAPLQSPTFSLSNASNRYADLGDIFSEVGDISAGAGGAQPPSSAGIGKPAAALHGRQIPTPTSTTSSIAIPRPPSRRSESAARGRISPASISRADSVGSLEFRTASIGLGSSRGPSPLTIGLSDTIPLAVAFHEVVHAYFRGSDEARCQVKMTGDMMVSFPAGIIGVMANNPNPAALGFRIKNVKNLDSILPNKQLVTIDAAQSTDTSTVLHFNMATLTALLRRQYEQNPTASYFNVDILKYQIRAKPGAGSCPFQLVCYWKCEPTHTDIKIDYKYNSHAMAAASPLLNVAIAVPVDGGVRNVQSKPHSAWLGESSRLQWNFTDISQHSDNNGVGTLRARLEVAAGPSVPAMLTAQFNCEGTTVSGIEFELVGGGYRLSLVKRRFVSGKYICEADGIRNAGTPTPPLLLQQQHTKRP